MNQTEIACFKFISLIPHFFSKHGINRSVRVVYYFFVDDLDSLLVGKKELFGIKSAAFVETTSA